MIGDHDFALCLTHDVDRPYKSFRSLYYALAERPGYHLRTLVSGENPYWQFDTVARLERDLGVRSAFYVLDEPHLLLERPPRDWLSLHHWVQHLGRYDVGAQPLAKTFRALDAGGWEIGLHGSTHSFDDRDRLAAEKRAVESILDHSIAGGRQHYLQLDGPRTWRRQRDVGLRYDSSLGSSTEYGFDHGYEPLRPFDDEFVVFPLTAMETALPDPGGDQTAARAACDRLLDEAAANGATMTVLWHVRYFSDAEFPGYRDLYRHLIKGAIDRNGWVGPPGVLYDRLRAADRPGA